MKEKKEHSSEAVTTLMGTVMRSTGSWYKVRLDDGRILDCRLAGKIRLEGLKSTNPVAVGDRVELEEAKETGSILNIQDRRNFIPRKSINLSKQVHILCANVDQALIFFTVAHPVTTLGYVDRLVVTCDAYDVEPVIVFNKIDLLDTPELQLRLQSLGDIYRNAGYRVVEVSATSPAHADAVRDLLKDKVSFLVGRSGTGKSTLVNLADPLLNLATGKVSDFSGKGTHTTTFAEMHLLHFGGAIIDAPGFKEMELYGFDKSEVAHFFPEMRARLSGCRFNNCLHLEEPGCAIVEAVEEGEIPLPRYHTYIGMLREAQ
jgi:ribosome biogenesis GTPase / thiamine phosphate phosphatase